MFSFLALVVRRALDAAAFGLQDAGGSVDQQAEQTAQDVAPETGAGIWWTQPQPQPHARGIVNQREENMQIRR